MASTSAHMCLFCVKKHVPCDFWRMAAMLSLESLSQDLKNILLFQSFWFFENYQQYLLLIDLHRWSFII